MKNLKSSTITDHIKISKRNLNLYFSEYENIITYRYKLLLHEAIL